MQGIHIGSLPPIQNGISVYLYRLSKIEKNSVFINWDQISNSKQFRTWLIKQLFSFKKKNFIFHPPSIKQRLTLFLFSFFSIHEFSLVIHGLPLIDQYNESRIFTKFLIREMLNNAKFVQVVNPIHIKFLKHLKIKNKNIILKNAFLPPPLEDENKILNSYEKELMKFLKNKNPTVVANGARVYIYRNLDGYGIDMCVELTFLLKKDFPNIGFLFVLSETKMHRDYFLKMKKRIKELDIESNFYFMTGSKELWPIFKRVDLMVRPTIWDGDSTSVREALYFNCPVIASDVTSRPQGTILFKNRDLTALYATCKEVLNTNRNDNQ